MAARWLHLLALIVLPIQNHSAIAADILWVPVSATLQPDAAAPVLVKNGRSIYVDGSGSVGFIIEGDREAVARQIVRHFAHEGWSQRALQHLNPRLATSFESGWERRCICLTQADAHGNAIPREPLYQWRGEWENGRGDLLTYALSAEGQHVRGYAEFLPAESTSGSLRKRTSGISALNVAIKVG